MFLSSHPYTVGLGATPLPDLPPVVVTVRTDRYIDEAGGERKFRRIKKRTEIKYEGLGLHGGTTRAQPRVRRGEEKFTRDFVLVASACGMDTYIILCISYIIEYERLCVYYG